MESQKKRVNKLIDLPYEYSLALLEANTAYPFPENSEIVSLMLNLTVLEMEKFPELQQSNKISLLFAFMFPRYSIIS